MVTKQVIKRERAPGGIGRMIAVIAAILTAVLAVTKRGSFPKL